MRNPFKYLYLKYRIRSIKTKSDFYYTDILRCCSALSASNHNFAYRVYRIGIFSGTKVEQIKRPNNIVLSEIDSYVIVRDGKIWSLNNN